MYLSWFLAVVVHVYGQPDPCTSYMLEREPLRSTGYVSTTPDYDHLLCDDLLTKGWYRFTSIAGEHFYVRLKYSVRQEIQKE